MNGPSNLAAVELSAEDVCEPASQDWDAILQINVANRPQRWETFGADLFDIMRCETLAAARDYTACLNSLAADAGLPTSARDPNVEVGTSAGARGIVATGHQPTIFHPGILAKNRKMSELVRSSGAIGLMISIDTDTGDAGRLMYPCLKESGRREIEYATVGTQEGLFKFQRVSDPVDIANVARRMQSALTELGFVAAARRTATTLSHYARMTGQPMGDANAVIRHLWDEPHGCLELPLSRLACLSSIRQFLRSLVQDGNSLHATYNAVLSRYRETHKIRNRANPFPFLSVDKEMIELPFWIVDQAAGTRHKLFVDREHPTIPMDADSHIVPRGMMITTLLRLIVSDIFIHGTGGAKYDRCTDQFLTAYFKTPAVPYVSATRTQYLFVDELGRAAAANASLARVRDVRDRFQKHVSSGTFQGDDRVTATDLLARRTKAIERLRTAKSAGESAAAVNQELKAVDSEIRSFVQRSVAPDMPLEMPSKEALAVLMTRAFPFFFFSKPSC